MANIAARNFISLPHHARRIEGQRFGRLVALGPVVIASDKHIMWLCQCDCGNTATVRSSSLKPGATASCGCLQKEQVRRSATKHGMNRTKAHRSWRAMKARCENPNHSRYNDYGGRGISVYSEWQHNFQAFYNHVSKLPHFGEKGYTIDRIDNNGNYEPGNVRWASWPTQYRNTRRNRLITHNDKTQCLTDWAKEVGLTYTTLNYRLKAGWSMEDALATPSRSKKGKNHE